MNFEYSDDTVQGILEHIAEVEIAEIILPSKYARKDTLDDVDELFDEAKEYVISNGTASVGMLQRAFRIGFNRAVKIMDQLADAKIVSGETGTAKRTVLVKRD